MYSLKNVLAPLEFVVSGIGGIMVFLTVVMVPTAIFGSGSFLGFGNQEACVDAPRNAVEVVRTSVPVVGLQHGATSSVSRVEVCDFHPSRHQLVLQIGTLLPQFVFFLGVLLAIWLTLRAARKHGLFSPHVALDVLRMGTYLFVGSMLAAAIQAEASARLLQTLTGADARGGLLVFFDMPWALVIVSFATLTVGRTLANAVRMQREIDATV
jgi:hypothetical protein